MSKNRVPDLFGIDISNILQAAFTLADPKSTKYTDDLAVLFSLFGSAALKAVHKMLVKLRKSKSH